VLLRYLTDAYKAFVQTVPESAKTTDLYDVSDWLGLTVRSIDASLLAEWEELTALSDPSVVPVEREEEDELFDITRDERGFTTMVRNAVWKLVRFLAFQQYGRVVEALTEADAQNGWTEDRLREVLAPYWAEYEAIEIGPDARSSTHLQIERSEREWRLTQILLDPKGDRGWHLRLRVDLAASRDAGEPRLGLLSIGE
jgi:hypothetical protein